MEGTNPLTMSEGLSTETSLPLGRNLDLENTKILSEVLKLHPSQWLSQHIWKLLIYANILELYSSLLHDVTNVEVLNFYVLHLIIEHEVRDNFRGEF